MLKRIGVLAMAVATVFTAGCAGPTGGGGGGGDSKPPPGQDWFGNPIPTGPACPVPEARSREFVPYNPESGGRPPFVPAGWAWIVITLRLQAVGYVTGERALRVDRCVGATVHVGATQEFNPRPIKMNMGNGQVTPLPFDGDVTTPWLSTYFVFAYNPKPEPPAQAPPHPPVYEIDFRAFWDAEIHDSDYPNIKIRSLVCHIGIGGGYFVVEGKSAAVSRGRMSTECKYKHAHYWVS